MGLSDRIFRRKASQDGAPAAFEQEAAGNPVEIPDATVILPPAPPQGDPQTMIIPAEAAAGAERFPAPPPPIEPQPQPQAEQQPASVDPSAASGELAPAPQAAPVPAAPQRPGFRERGRLRRRLRYLKQVRELGYRDLGGLVFDQHRFERGDAALVEGKVLAIETLDREIRALEEVLQLQTPYVELFIPGVSACARCGTLHGSDAHFCPHCGLAFGGPRSVAGLGSVGANSVYDVGQQPPAPASDPYNPQPGSGPAG
jgi:hypothetical protein